MTHLIVLTHGLWGTPSHVEYIEKQIKQAYPHVAVYKTGSHSDFRTYDGIDINGQRICDEILAETERLGTVTHFSIVGYSLGGLISRYAIGVLYSEGYFDRVEPCAFITMCTPHVGALSPLKGFKYSVANLFSHHFIGSTGAQLFLKDSVYGNPLLVVMADEASVFYKALARFRKRSLYANVMNDRRTFYYTAAISASDPFASMTNKRPDRLALSFVEGYEPVVDLSKPASIKKEEKKAPSKRDVRSGFVAFVKTATHLVRVSVLTPIFALHFIGVSVLERMRHNRRVREFLATKSLEHYYLRDRQIEKESIVEAMYDVVNEDTVVNLDTNQRFVISSLNRLGWERFPVLITKTEHSHAAAIVRFENPDFDEGKGVVSHLVEKTIKEVIEAE